MSTSLGSVRSTSSNDLVADRVYVTRFYGGVQRGTCVQVTIDGRFVQLDHKGIKKLRKQLKRGLQA